MKDYMGNPIIVAVEPVGKGQYYGIHIPSNVTLSGYGRKNIVSYWETAVKEQRVLYAEESDRLTNLGVQFPNVLQTAAFDTIIRNYRELVNRKIKKDAKIFGNSALNIQKSKDANDKENIQENCNSKLQ